jgi:hypothetical protein
VGFGKRLRKHFKKAIGRAINPVKAGVDLSRSVTRTLHPVTTAIGKVDAVAYGTIGGGLVGAAITKRSGNKKIFGGTGVDTIAPAAIQIEKPLLAVTGGLLAGGVGSKLGSFLGDEIAPNDPAQPFTPPGFADGGDGGPFQAHSTRAPLDPMLVMVVVGGGLLLLVLLLRRR